VRRMFVEVDDGKAVRLHARRVADPHIQQRLTPLVVWMIDAIEGRCLISEYGLCTYDPKSWHCNQDEADYPSADPGAGDATNVFHESVLQKRESRGAGGSIEGVWPCAAVRPKLLSLEASAIRGNRRSNTYSWRRRAYTNNAIALSIGQASFRYKYPP